MKVFIFTHSADGERELIAERDMTQIPHVGEGVMSSQGRDLITRPVLAVHHFVLASESQQGAFLIVGEPQVAEHESVIAPLFAG